MGRFITIFILLSVITVLLLGFSIRFFTAAPVRAQIGTWIGQAGPESAGSGYAQPLLPGRITAMPTITSIVLPTATPLPTQPPVTPTAAATLFAGPTPEPVYQVVEDPIPQGSLVIPSLGIDQPIVPVHVRDQAWDLQTLGTDIGWLQTTGSYPLDNVAMVFVGHITLPPPGGPGPFLNLSSLKPGDAVIYRDGQKTYTYEISGETIVEPDAVQQLYRPDGRRILLVTCTGYNPIEWRYDLRLVIEAVLVDTENQAELR